MSRPLKSSGLTRRGFVKGAAAAAAVPLVLPGMARAAADDPEVLRIGLIGCGGRGTGATFQALSAENGTHIPYC